MLKGVNEKMCKKIEIKMCIILLHKYIIMTTEMTTEMTTSNKNHNTGEIYEQYWLHDKLISEKKVLSSSERDIDDLEKNDI